MFIVEYYIFIDYRATEFFLKKIIIYIIYSYYQIWLFTLF